MNASPGSENGQKWTKTDFIARNIICGLLVSYIVSALFILPVMERSEVFPVFDWRLYDQITPRRTVFELRTEPPTDNSGANKGFFSHKNFYLIQIFGNSILNRSPEVQLREKQLDGVLKEHFGDQIKKYSIWHSDVDINDYWLNGKVIRTQMIFEKEFNP